jgi:hypothetical protein
MKDLYWMIGSYHPLLIPRATSGILVAFNEPETIFLFCSSK